MLARLVGGTGCFFSGLGVHALAIVPELKYTLVVRFDADGEFAFPDRAGNLKIYQMIAAARTQK
jgi:hypothetical protein